MCRDCRKTRTIFRLNVNTRLPEEDVFCVRCLQKARLPEIGPPPLMKARVMQNRVVHRERPREQRVASAERYTAAHDFNYDELLANHERASSYDGPFSIQRASSSPAARAPVRARGNERAIPNQRSTEPAPSKVSTEEPQEDPLLMANRRSALVQQQFQSFLERQKVVDRYKNERSTVISSPTTNQEPQDPLQNDNNRRSAKVQEEFELYVDRRKAKNERQTPQPAVFKVEEEPEDPCLIAHRRSAVVKKQLEPFYDRRQTLIDPDDERSTELIDSYDEELDDPFLVANRRSAFVQQEFESYVERRNASEAQHQSKQVRFHVPRSSAPVLPSQMQMQERFSQPFERPPVAGRMAVAATLNRSHSCPIKEVDIDQPRALSATPMPRSNQFERRRNTPPLPKKVSWTEE